ncbi:unnamed protein product [Dicrocoelium dendriticum]|nr:unnamed protein product [Dicrocoelium dendriticum]
MAATCPYNCNGILLALLLPIVIASITEEDKALILKLHNDFRHQLLRCNVTGQPPVAGPMPDLKWHDQLAAQAETLSKTCVFHHGGDPNFKIPEFPVSGQNIAAGGDTLSAINLWMNEYKDYVYDNHTCRRSMCGHYTQVAWAETTHIGCSVTDCSNVKSFGYKNFYVCNYGPAGNYAGVRPYKKGRKADCRSKASEKTAAAIFRSPVALCILFTSIRFLTLW